VATGEDRVVAAGQGFRPPLYMDDQDGMHPIGVAVAALALDPNPRNAFIRGDYRRLRVGPYRVMYVIDDPGLHGRPLESCPQADATVSPDEP